ncbi:MAG: AAA family ATPase [Actinomycetaceae bacterium]|nr:AAA family ATPase [Actinomycetaceae bacterium]
MSTSPMPAIPSGPDSEASLDAEMAIEQHLVDLAYNSLDKLRTFYRSEQIRVHAEGASGTPQARMERDAFSAHFGDEASRLEQVEERLVFGRLDMSDSAVARYVGRVGLRKDSATSEQLLIDWRAPAARAFYSATAVAPQGVVRRRHIGTHLRKVTSLEDELLDTSQGIDHSTLQGEGALIAAVSQARQGHMSDIVATIQAQQDAVIRSQIDGLVVVQGGPGTGKTAVALHRAAYLLYTYRERLARSGLLIVGPSKVFLRYIEQVLPSLGETGVVSTTLADLIPGITATEYDTPEVAAVKGSMLWVQIAKRAVKGLQRLPEEDQILKVPGGTVTFTRHMAYSAMLKAQRSNAAHNVAREIFARTCVEALTDAYAGESADPDDRSWMREDVRTAIDVKRAVNLCWMPTAPQTLLERLYSRPELLKIYAPELSESEREVLYRPKGSAWTVEDIPILDELAELLGPHVEAEAIRTRDENRAREARELQWAQEAIDSQDLGGGIVSAAVLAGRYNAVTESQSLAERAGRDRAWTYGHIVVDEAQELSPLAWNVLMRRCPARSFTVVGDLDQRSASQSYDSWEEILGPAVRAGVRKEVLTISYRTPESVLKVAQDVRTKAGFPPKYPMQAARDVPDALAFTQTTHSALVGAVKAALKEEIARLDATEGRGRGRLAVIVASGATGLYGRQLSDVGYDPVADRVVIVDAQMSKGLEFDTVILVEPADIAKEALGDLYVAMTRPTKRLRILHSRPLPAGMHPH